MQVVRIDGGLALVRGREGLFLVPRNDIYIGAAIEAYGEYSPDEARFICEILKEGDCVIEIGSSIGALTIPMARKIGRGLLWAYEPQKFFFAFLQAQIALNRAHNVIARNIACWEAPATLWMPNIDLNAPANFGSLNTVPFELSSGMIPTTATTLDDDFPSDTIAPALIKADVEGSEIQVLSGGGRLIQKHLPLLYIENDRPDKAQALIKFIADLGYQLWWHTPPMFSEENCFGTRINLYKNTVSFNMLCIHRSKVEAYAELTKHLAIVDPLSSVPAAMSCEAKP